MLDLDALRLTKLREKTDPNALTIEQQTWGYTVKAGQMPPFGVLAVQLLSFFLGVCFITASLGLLTLPGAYSASDLGAMRIGGAGLFVAGAAYLLWFASRGSQVEVQVNTVDRVIREVIDNRAGRPTILNTYAFDDLGGAYLETGAGNGATQLVVEYDGKRLLVADGAAAQIGALRDRLARDLHDTGFIDEMKRETVMDGGYAAASASAA